MELVLKSAFYLSSILGVVVLELWLYNQGYCILTHEPSFELRAVCILLGLDRGTWEPQTNWYFGSISNRYLKYLFNICLESKPKGKLGKKNHQRYLLCYPCISLWLWVDISLSKPEKNIFRAFIVTQGCSEVYFTYTQKLQGHYSRNPATNYIHFSRVEFHF